MSENVSRRGFFRRCVAAAVAAPALPTLAGAAALPATARTTAEPGQWVNFSHEHTTELWNHHPLLSLRDFEAFPWGAARPKAPSLEWLVTEDRAPDVLPISVGTAAPS